MELRDIFQLQDTLMSGVVESLALPLTAGERRQLAHDAPASATAYDLYPPVIVKPAVPEGDQEARLWSALPLQATHVVFVYQLERSLKSAD